MLIVLYGGHLNLDTATSVIEDCLEIHGNHRLIRLTQEKWLYNDYVCVWIHFNLLCMCKYLLILYSYMEWHLSIEFSRFIRIS